MENYTGAAGYKILLHQTGFPRSKIVFLPESGIVIGTPVLYI
jgi:hypothetical protein